MAETTDPVWPALARNFLPRRLSVICRAFRCRGVLSRAADADICEHRWSAHNDRDGSPDLVVQSSGTRVRPAQANAGRRPRRGTGMRTVIAATLMILAGVCGA